MADRTPELAFVMPMIQRPFWLPPYWAQILDQLAELEVSTEVIDATVRPLVNEEEPPPGRRAVLPSAPFIRTLLRSAAPVLLCVEYGVATLVTIAAARLRGKKTIIFQEHTGRQGLRLPAWERRYRKLLGSLAQAVIANTDAAYDEVTEVLGVSRSKVFRATILVPPERALLSREPGNIPQPARRPLFLFVGRLVRVKNIDGLLEAAAALKARGFEFELWIVGDGPQRQALEGKAADLIGDGVVRFLGSRPNDAVGPVYEVADIFVLPSTREYRSVAVLEALRFGKPVIDSSRDGNVGDLVRHEHTGLVFDPDVSGALEAAMERLIVEPDMRQALGERVSDLMEAHTPGGAAEALCDVLRAVQAGDIGRKRRHVMACG